MLKKIIIVSKKIALTDPKRINLIRFNSFYFKTQPNQTKSHVSLSFQEFNYSGLTVQNSFTYNQLKHSELLHLTHIN